MKHAILVLLSNAGLAPCQNISSKLSDNQSPGTIQHRVNAIENRVDTLIQASRNLMHIYVTAAREISNSTGVLTLKQDWGNHFCELQRNFELERRITENRVQCQLSDPRREILGSRLSRISMECIGSTQTAARAEDCDEETWARTADRIEKGIAWLAKHLPCPDEEHI